MKTISILTLKGGQAKTTTALALAQSLRLQNKKVLTIDLDFQQNLTILLEKNNPINIYTLLTSQNPDQLIDKAIIDDLICSDENILQLDSLDPKQLKKILALVSNSYDYTIIDNHCIVNALTLNSLLASDLLIIPAKANKLGYIGADDMISFLDLVKVSYKANIKAKILLSDFYNNVELNKQYRELIEELATNKKVSVCKTIIRHSQPIEDSQALGNNLFDYSKRSNGAKDFITLAKEIIEEE